LRFSIDRLEIIIEPDGNEGFMLRNTPALFDRKTGTWRILPFQYFYLKKLMSKRGIKVKTLINEDFSLNRDLLNKFSKKYSLRDYQEEAINYLSSSNWRGVIVLPTGAGKTIIGIEAIYRLKVRTLIVVPTIELMNQWVNNLIQSINVPRGRISLYGGGSYQIGEITVVTYASARKKEFLEKAIDYFGLVIFDEAHHLTGKLNSEIARRLIAKYRIGLTATPGEGDAVNILKKLVGPIYKIAGFKSLVSKGFLAPFDFKQIFVKLNPDEEERYGKLMAKYLDCVKKIDADDEIERFNELVKRSVRDREAREALLARIEAKNIAMRSKEKIKTLDKLLEKHASEKVIIFTRYRENAMYISSLFGFPYITGDMDKKRRKEILSMFRRGEITKLVAAEVLDEGIDIPSASVGIILAGRPSKRQLIQRIGRLLRPSGNKKAMIYEVITSRTYDYFASRKRRVRMDEL